jgi:YfiH family protein
MGFFRENNNGVLIWKHTELMDLDHGFCGSGIDGRKEDSSLLASRLNVPSITLLKQVHGTDFYSSGSPCEEADAFFIQKGDGTYGIKTADCVPLILINKDHTMCALLHCGWRGTVDGIVLKALNLFSERGIRPQSIHAYSGPAAQICCYEIGQEVAERFESAVSLPGSDFSSPLRREGGKFLGSVTSIIRSHLLSSSVPEDQINILGECTICHEGYYSHRKGDGERQISFISL